MHTRSTAITSDCRIGSQFKISFCKKLYDLWLYNLARITAVPIRTRGREREQLQKKRLQSRLGSLHTGRKSFHRDMGITSVSCAVFLEVLLPLYFRGSVRAATLSECAAPVLCFTRSLPFQNFRDLLDGLELHLLILDPRCSLQLWRGCHFLTVFSWI